MLPETQNPEKQIERLIELVDTLVTVLDNVVMDTPDDQALHDKAIETFRSALNTEREFRRQRLSKPKPGERTGYPWD